MAFGDLYSLTVHGEVHGQAVLNVFHYMEGVVGIDPDPVAALATTFQTQNQQEWIDAHSIEYKIVGYIAQKIRPLPISVAFSLPSGSSGTVVGACLPSSVSAVITKRTALGGAAHRGRVFLGGVPASFENDSQVSAAGSLAYTNLADALDDPLVTAGGYQWAPTVFHRATGTHTLTTAWQPRPVLRNQRRRQVGRGI